MLSKIQWIYSISNQILRINATRQNRLAVRSYQNVWFLPCPSHRFVHSTTSVGYATEHGSNVHVVRGDLYSRFSDSGQWSKSELKCQTNRLITLLERQEGYDNDMVTADQIFSVLEAWVEFSRGHNGLEAAHQAEHLLRALETHVPVGSSIYPKTSYYNVVLHSYAEASCREGALAAQTLLDRMLDNVKKYHNKNRKGKEPPYPSIKSFHIVLHAWAKSRCRDAGIRTEAILDYLPQWNNFLRANNKSKKECVPDERTPVYIVNAWTNSGSPEAPERAVAILNRTVAEEGRTHRSLLSIELFNATLQSFAKSNHGRYAAMKAEEILRMLLEYGSNRSDLQPNSRTYASLIETWGQCETHERTGEASQRATKILSEMLEMYRSGKDVVPNSFCFSNCITAWSHCRNMPDAPAQAEELLNSLIDLYDETKDPDFEPGIATINAVVSTWVRSSGNPDAIERGRLVLKRLESLSKPDIVSYNTLLGGMGKRGMYKEALELVHWLERQSTDLKPDLVTYNSVLQACARSSEEISYGDLEKFLETMVSSGVEPCKISYTTVLDAYSRSRDDQKVFRAQKIVDSMIERFENGVSYLRPDTHVFTALMKCCALTSPESPHADMVLSIAMESMESLKNYDKPNHVSYGTLLQAIKNLSKTVSSTIELQKKVFDACVHDGCVSLFVIRSLIPFGKKQWASRIPIEWCHQVPKRDRPSVR